MNIIDELNSQSAAEIAAARERYCELIARAAEGASQPGDAAQLRAVLATLGRTPADAAADVALIQELRTADAAAADVEPATAALSEAFAAQEAAAEEADAVRKRLDLEKEQHEANVGNAAHRRIEAIKARNRARDLRNHWEAALRGENPNDIIVAERERRREREALASSGKLFHGPQTRVDAKAPEPRPVKFRDED